MTRGGKLAEALWHVPPIRLAWIGVGGLAVFTALDILVLVGELGYYDVDYAWSIAGSLSAGAQVTLGIVLIVIPLGFAVGFLVGWARTSRRWWLQAVASVYVEFFRGLPPLVLIFFSSLIVSLVARSYFYVENPSNFGIAAGAVSLALHSAAYQAEIVRAGILSVPNGQVEAGEALGMSPWKTMSRVVMPQAFRVSLPALGNEFASVIKDTSLLSIIGMTELSFFGGLFVNDAIRTAFGRVFIIWTEIAILYFVLTFAVTRTVRGIENGFKVPGLEAAQL